MSESETPAKTGTILHSFSTGMRQANRSARMIFLLYGINFIAAALITLAFRFVLVSSLGSSMAVEKLVGGFDFVLLSDFLASNPGKLGLVFSQAFWMAVVYVVVYTFLGGGIISTLSTDGQVFSLGSFLGLCGTYFSRFLRLLLLFGVLLAAVGFILLLILGAVYNALTANTVSEVMPIVLGIGLGLVFFIAISILLTASDYAKITTVLNSRTKMFRVAREGLRLVARHFSKVLGLQVVLLLVSALVIFLYLLIESQVTVTGTMTIFVMFVVQQAAVSARVWTRVLTVASQMKLFKNVTRFGEEPLGESIVQVPVSQPQPVAVLEEVTEVAEPIVKKKLVRRRKRKKRVATRTRAKKSYRRGQQKR